MSPEFQALFDTFPEKGKRYTLEGDYVFLRKDNTNYRPTILKANISNFPLCCGLKILYCLVVESSLSAYQIHLYIEAICEGYHRPFAYIMPEYFSVNNPNLYHSIKENYTLLTKWRNEVHGNILGLYFLSFFFLLTF